MKSAGLVTRSTASASQIGSNAAPPGTAMRSPSMRRLRAATQNAAGAVRTRDRSKPRSCSSSARIDGSADIAPTATSSADRLATSAGNNSDAAGELEQIAPVVCRERRGDRDGRRWCRGRCGAGDGGEPPDPNQTLRGAGSLAMEVPCDQRERHAALFRHQTQRLIGVDAAGHRQIEKTGDGWWD